jgi:hypothetical protein
MNRHIVFTVERLTQEDGCAFVDGRVCESAIRVGDVFSKVYGHKQWVDVDPGPTHAVRLVIQSIYSYRRLWGELSPGMTARLKLTGDGLERLSEGMILGDDSAEQPRCSEPGDSAPVDNRRSLAPGH